MAGMVRRKPLNRSSTTDVPLFGSFSTSPGLTGASCVNQGPRIRCSRRLNLVESGICFQRSWEPHMTSLTHTNLPTRVCQPLGRGLKWFWWLSQEVVEKQHTRSWALSTQFSMPRSHCPHRDCISLRMLNHDESWIWDIHQLMSLANILMLWGVLSLGVR